VIVPDSLFLANVYNNLGNAFISLQRPECALHAFKRTLRIRRRRLAGDHLTIVNSYFNVATIYQSMGRTHKALKYNTRCIEILEQSQPQSASLIQYYSSLGNIYLSVRRYA